MGNIMLTTLSRPKSEKIYRELCDLLPGGVNSPIRAFKAVNQLPMVASYGIEDQIYDEDGNGYIDYCGSFGALIHGHAHPAIVEAIQDSARKGTTFGVTTAIEGQLAEKIIELMPSIEKIRFVSSGTEATMSAIRLARGHTKKELVIKFSGNYHGHADFFLIKSGSSVINLSESTSDGIPQTSIKSSISLPYNDLEAFQAFVNKKEIRDSLAAVIVEPIAGNMGVVPASKDFLSLLRKETKKMGALLIFDEVITGFRVSSGGAQQLYQIVPDLTCLGKIMGGGLPAAAFGGRREIMDCLAPLGSVYQAGTLSGNPIAMTAGLKALELVQQPNFYEELENKANLLLTPLEKYLAENNVNACIQKMGSMFTLFLGCKKVDSFESLEHIDKDQFARFFQFLFERGIYIPPSQYEAWFISISHKKDHLQTTAREIIQFFKSENPT